MIKSKLLKNEIFFLFLFLTFFIFPHGTGYFFDGLPFNNKNEIIFFSLIVPYFFYFKKYFKLKIIRVLILFTIFLKLILQFSPNSGIGGKQFFIDEKNSQDKLIKTFHSFWNNKYSFIQKFNYDSKNDFPIDWTIVSEINQLSKFDEAKLDIDQKNQIKFNKFNYIKFRYDDGNDFINQPLHYNWIFFILIEDKEYLKFNFDGSNNIDLKIDKNNKSYLSKQLKKNIFKLDSGYYQVEVKGDFYGKNWKSKILKSKDGYKYKSAFKTRDLFVDKNYDIKFIKFFKIISYFYDGIIFLIILVLSFFVFKNKKKEIFFLVAVIFSFLVINHILDILIPSIGVRELISLSCTLCFFTIFISLNKISFNGRDVFFIIIAPLILGVVLYNNFYDINSFGYWSKGDDWTAFQTFAREIVVHNQWINEEEKYTIRRYALRLVISVFKIIFGQSKFPLIIFETWSIIVTSYLLFKISKLNNLGEKLSIVCGVMLLIFYFGDNFRWLIGRGLSAFYATFFIMLLSYYFTKWTLDYKKILLAGFIGGLIIWFREDYSIVVFSLIFLNFNKLRNSLGMNNFVFFKDQVIKNLNFISLYLFILITFVILILLKNYYQFGSFDSYVPSMSPITGKIEAFKNIFRNDFDHVIYYGAKNSWWDSYYRMFFAADPNHFPRITSIFLVGSFLISIYYILNNFNKLGIIKPGFLIIPIALFFTYTLINNAAYNPRYIVHFLPFSLLICLMFLKKFLKKTDY